MGGLPFDQLVQFQIFETGAFNSRIIVGKEGQILMSCILKV